MGARPKGFDKRTSTELTDKRTALSRVYRNADGSTTRRLYQRAVHALTRDGAWAPIDLGLTSDVGGRWAPRLGRYEVSFAPTAGDRELVRLTLDSEHRVAFGMATARTVPARVSGPTASYAGVRPHADIELTATNNGLKEDIVLRSAAAPTAYEFGLRLQGLTPAHDRITGNIRLVDEAGAVRAVVPAGWMKDARGVTSREVGYRISRAGGDWVVRVDLDRAWLTDRRRVYPVTVDPSVQINDDLDDTYVVSGAPADRSGEIQLQAGKDPATSRTTASYLHFSRLVNDLRNQYVNGATLAMYNVDSPSCTPKPVDVFAVGAPWSGSTMTTWPGAPLAQHLGQQSFAFGKPACPANRGYFSLPADVVTDWTHGAPFHGLSVRAANEGDPGAFKRFAAANVNNAGVPYLDVTYAAQGAAYSVEEVTLPTATRNGQIKAIVRNRGSATWIPGGSHKFGFIVKQGNTVVQTSPKFDVPQSVAPNGSVAMTVPMAPLTPADYQVYLTMYDGASDYRVAYGVPYGVFGMKVVNVKPTSNHQQPGSGVTVDSIRPTLYAEGVDPDNWPNSGLKYNFKVCTKPDGTTGCTQSGWTNATWAPPAGTLRWSETYYWYVQVHDNVDTGPWVGPLTLTTQVPQPEITSHLGGTPNGAPAPGLDPQVGNYGMETTDASVATVGPDLTIDRTYNSLDPRATNAFGEGWASRLDTDLVADLDGSGNVVVTLPSGRQVRFGQNADLTFAPPTGQNLTLHYDTSTAEYTLRDSSGSRWVFNACGKLRQIIDPAGLVEELEYTVACPNGKPTGVRNLTSGRRLHLTWTGAHVTQVRTDPPVPGGSPLTWTYEYDGDRLLRACNPAPAPNCTRYDYEPGSHYRSVVLDDSPRGYWRLGESLTTDGAANATARTPDADKGIYTGVALAVPGALAGTADTSGTFDGTASRLALPPKLTSSTMTLSVELWFRTAGTDGGVLMSYADQPFGSASGRWTPVLYVGQDGRLRGGFWVPKPNGQRQIVSDTEVNDGRWHHVVLSGAINSQRLYIDGVAQKDDSAPTQDDTVSGIIDHDEMPHLVVGAGKTKYWPAGNDGDFYFKGTIDEVAVYQHPLGATAIAEHHAAARQVQQLTKITLPQDNRVAAVLDYDDITDRVATYTDHDGRAWRLDTPSRNGAVRRVTLHGPYPDWTYEFDADHGGRLNVRTHDGKSRLYRYNTEGFRSEEVDELGHKATFTTDRRGNVLSRTTCRAVGSCQTAYSTYFLNTANRLDPRNDRKLTDSDARSTGPTDTTYRTSYSYDAAGRLVSATFPRPAGVGSGPTETWKYSIGTEPADGGGTTPAGLLIEHTGRRPSQVARYVYRSTGDLTEQVNPSGLRTRFGYDAIGRPVSETPMTSSGQSFGTTTYTYTPRSEIDVVTSPTVTNTVSGEHHTLVTDNDYDANGNRTQITLRDTTGADPPRITSFSYDEHDTLRMTTFPDGKRESREFRNAGMEERITDARGTTWINSFDSQGRLLRRIASGVGVDPEDPAETVLALETRSYDAAGRLAATRDAMGRETRFTYFDDDRLATATRIGVLQADGETRRDVLLEQHEYDPAGNASKLTTAGGLVTTSTYDPAGLPATSTLDPTGLARTTAYTRHPDGLVATESRTGAAQPGRVETTSYGYDAAGLLVREDVQPTPGDTLSVTYLRDERGLVTERADRRRLPTTFGYDALGRLVTETGSAVDTWTRGVRRTGVAPQRRYGYNAFGETTHTRDEPDGEIATVGYDVRGRATSVQLPDYAPPGGQLIRAVTRIEYDELGNPISTTDPLDRTTTRTFDPYGRQLTETLPQVGTEPSTTTSRYDRNGEQVSVTDPNGATIMSTYDEMGRQITRTAVERHPAQAYFVTRFGYDEASNLVTVTTPLNKTTRYDHNAAGEQLSSTDPTERVTGFSYDIVGRQLSSTDPAGIVTRSHYDLLGRATDTVQLAGDPLAEQRRWQREYDPNDNLTKLTSPEGRVTSFGYDAADRLVRQDEEVDATKTIRTTFGHDAVGNRTRFVDGKGNATHYTFTPWGMPESTTEPATAATPDATDRTWTTSYDAAGQAVRQAVPGGITITTDYDEQGRTKAQQGAGAEASTADRTFGYDPNGRLTSFGAPGGSTVLTYDDRGNLLTTRGPSGDATFTYTAENRLASRSGVAGTSTFSYDNAGRPSVIVDGLSDRTIDHAYDPAGRLSYTAERGMERYVKRVTAYDQLGRRTADKLTEFDPNGGPPRIIHGTEYGYDRDDNLTTKNTVHDNVAKANEYGYDGANRLTSWEGIAGTTAYEWDDAGNRTKAGTTTFSYNERNQLVSADTTQYTYTPRGTLATTGGQTPTFDAFDQLAADGITYSYDSVGRVAKRGETSFGYEGLENDVVADGSRLTSRGITGEPLSDKAVGSTTTAKLLYADQHGDVTGRFRGLDADGDRTYDPFGTVTGASGETPSMGYQGEWTEPTTGAVNMHARWYTPGTGTFTSRDTWTLPPQPSVAANRYTYGNANPLVTTDPSGHGPRPPSCSRERSGNLCADVIGALTCLPMSPWQIPAHMLGCGAGTTLSGCDVQMYVNGIPCTNYLWRICKNPSPRDLGWCTPPDTANDVPSCRTVSCYRHSPALAPGGKPGDPSRPSRPYRPYRPKLPPPPPPWWFPIHNPPPRLPPGQTVRPRPPQVRADDQDTIVIDRSDQYTDEATEVTQLPDPWVIPLPAGGGGLGLDQFPDQDDRDDCLSGRAPTGEAAHDYWGLDALARARGASTCLDASSIVPEAHRRDPYRASPRVAVAGYVEGVHHKGHLIGAQFGGHGNRSDNLIPLTERANVRAMYHNFERCVKERLVAGERIQLTVVPRYVGTYQVPAAITLRAVGSQGYFRTFSVLNWSYAGRDPLMRYCA